jgi:hypothetical protein
MRFTGLLFAGAMLVAAPAFSQAVHQHPYGLDPFNPSDAKIRRDWGGALVAQTPLVEMGKLSDFNPSEAELRRRIGDGAIPLTITGFALDASSVWKEIVTHRAGALRVVPVPVAAAASAAPVTVAPQPTAMASVQRPDSNDGVWINFAGARYVSGGAAVPLDASTFMQVGQYAGFPVYRRQVGDDTIFLPTRGNLVAPYRRK